MGVVVSVKQAVPWPFNHDEPLSGCDPARGSGIRALALPTVAA